MKETKKDILRIIILINITLFLSLKVLYLFYIKDIFPAILMMLANICFTIGITYGIKNKLYSKYYYIISFLYFTGFSYCLVDNLKEFLFFLVIFIIAYLIYYFIVFSIPNIILKNKIEDDDTIKKQVKKDNSEKFDLLSFLVFISFCFAAYQLYVTLDYYNDKKQRMKEYQEYRMNKHKNWINKMTYNLEHLSKHHYMAVHHLGRTSSSNGLTTATHKFLKVIEVTDSEVKAVEFRASGYTLVPCLLEKSYMKEEEKDTITLNIEKLKKTIFKNIEINEYIYRYGDSLKREGLFWLISDIEYIDGPFIEKHIEESVSFIKDTLYFKFRNIDKKACLTKIVNVSGNAKWHNKLPIYINDYKLDSYKDEEFKLKATNVDLKKRFKFELHFEDSLKKEHVFLVNKNQDSSYECERVLD